MQRCCWLGCHDLGRPNRVTGPCGDRLGRLRGGVRPLAHSSACPLRRFGGDSLRHGPRGRTGFLACRPVLASGPDGAAVPLECCSPGGRGPGSSRGLLDRVYAAREDGRGRVPLPDCVRDGVASAAWVLGESAGGPSGAGGGGYVRSLALFRLVLLR